MANLPTFNNALVAYIDVLGFGNKLAAARTESGLGRLYDQLRNVQNRFEMRPERDIKNVHRSQKKTVLALSDAIVLAVDLKSPYARFEGELDTVAQELLGIAYAQVTCVLNGVFLRGGISMGPFWYGDRVLISPAMARAYGIESKVATYPVIAVNEPLYRKIKTHPENRYYLAEPRPVDLLKPYPQGNGACRLYFLDYLRIGFDGAADWNSFADLKRYKETSDHTRREKIMADSWRAHQRKFLRRHARVIKNALRRTRSGRVLKKYNWLRDYHNEFVHVLGLGWEDCTA